MNVCICDILVFSDADDDDDDVYECIHCKLFETFNLETMVDHCRTCKYMDRPNPYRFKYVCNTCNYGTYNISTLRGHISGHMGKKPHKCPICPFATCYEGNLSTHMRQKHGS